jgi:hypothetical protein
MKLDRNNIHIWWNETNFAAIAMEPKKGGFKYRRHRITKVFLQIFKTIILASFKRVIFSTNFT